MVFATILQSQGMHTNTGTLYVPCSIHELQNRLHLHLPSH